MTMSRILIFMMAVGFGGLFGASQTFAQNSPTPEARRAASELISLVSAGMLSEMMVKMTDQLWPAMEAAIRVRNPKIDPAALAELRKAFDPLMTNAMDDLMSDAPALYARHFTAEEMRDVIAFYRTPSGAKMLKTMPQVMAEFQATLAPRLQGMEERVNLAFLNLLQKRGYYAQ